MADKPIPELVAATQVTSSDLFVLEQNGTAKKLTGQTLENWLVSFADGHGGIQSITKTGTSGLTDTYTITLADTTTITFTVTNGRGVSSINKTSTSGLEDTYTVTYNDGSASTLLVTNGAKGDKGDNAYVHIKWASQEPTAASHDMSDIPDAWQGVYTGTSATAPTDWTQYKWYKIKGGTGDPGAAATLISSETVYQVSDSGTIIPSGNWSESVPVVPQGKYMWTRVTNTFNTGSPVRFYSATRMGMDGSGSVSSVNNIAPDENGNVSLSSEALGALPLLGGTMTGAIHMSGQVIDGLNDPTADDQAVRKAYVDTLVENQKATRTLLWSNAAAASSFANQTILSDVSGYDILAISCRYNTAYGYESMVLMPVLNSRYCSVYFPAGSIGSYTFPSTVSRYFGISSNALVAQQGYKDGTVDNTSCVPVAVYGIKLNGG